MLGAVRAYVYVCVCVNVGEAGSKSIILSWAAVSSAPRVFGCQDGRLESILVNARCHVCCAHLSANGYALV